MVLDMNNTFETHHPTIRLQQVAKTSSEQMSFKDYVQQFKLALAVKYLLWVQASSKVVQAKIGKPQLLTSSSQTIFKRKLEVGMIFIPTYSIDMKALLLQLDGLDKLELVVGSRSYFSPTN